jgi:hypothetical protein
MGSEPAPSQILSRFIEATIARGFFGSLPEHHFDLCRVFQETEKQAVSGETVSF